MNPPLSVNVPQSLRYPLRMAVAAIAVVWGAVAGLITVGAASLGIIDAFDVSEEITVKLIWDMPAELREILVLAKQWLEANS